jgi:alpha-glucosidase
MHPISSNATSTNADWWRGAVIYQIYPRSFADANGDGIGDLQGITRRLPYIASLNVDAIWISPIFQSPMKDFGYDVQDYRVIDPMFGTLDDLDACIAAAHALNLKVMVDQVLSHTSDQHAWFKESRASRDNSRADWYVWADCLPDGSPPNNWQSVFGGSAWTWDARRKQYYLHNFLASQPDLNYHCPAVQVQLLEDIEFWLRRGFDGFRFDTANYLHHDTLLRSNPARIPVAGEPEIAANPYDMQQHQYDKNRPENVAFFEKVRALMDRYGAASVGEVGDAEALALMLEYTAGNKRLNMTYSFAFLGTDHRASHIKRHASEFEAADQQVGANSWPCWTIGNHDATRVLTRWNGLSAPDDFIRLHLAMLCSLRGSVCWYQGDELCLEDADIPFEELQDPRGIAFWPEDKGRDGCRTPMPWDGSQPMAGFSNGLTVKPWLPIPAQHQRNTVCRAERDPDAALAFLRSFLAWRKLDPTLLHGAIRFLQGTDEVLALVRTPQENGHGQAWLCVFNFTDTALEVGLEDAPQSNLHRLEQLPEHQVGRRMGNHFELPAYGIYWGAVQP